MVHPSILYWIAKTDFSIKMNDQTLSHQKKMVDYHFNVIKSGCHPRQIPNFQTKFHCQNPQMCLSLCNYEYNDHLFIHCPFTWFLCEKLFSMINLSWVVLSSISNPISIWRSFPLRKNPKKIWKSCMLSCGLFEKRVKEDCLRIFLEMFLLFVIFSYFLQPPGQVLVFLSVQHSTL